ncbi:MAG: MoaD/ThiS family protein [Solirubrobacteraceae bacterium]
MPLVCVHGPLRQLAGDAREHQLQAATVLELLRELERAYPALCGWIVDERGLIRRHINVFVDGERSGEQTAVAAGARVEILPAITGG